MVTTCAVKDCLRPPASDNPSCKACQAGLPPMTNPQSPHAAANAGGFVPRIEKSGKPIQDGKKEMGVAKEVKPTQTAKTAQQKPLNSTEKLKKMGIDPAIAKKSVQMLFDTSWFNWEDGMPLIFDKLFKEFGNFISAKTQPSTMVGLPQQHRGIINVKSDASFVMLLDVVLPFEGKNAVLKMLNTNPTYTQKRGAVSAEDMMFAIENDGATFDFTLDRMFPSNKDMSIYTYNDGKTDREIPRWAIS